MSSSRSSRHRHSSSPLSISAACGRSACRSTSAATIIVPISCSSASIAKRVVSLNHPRMHRPHLRYSRPAHALAIAMLLAACHRAPDTSGRVAPVRMPPAPAAAPARWRGLIGEYDAPAGMRLVLENGGALWIADTNRHAARMVERGPTSFDVDPAQAEAILGRRTPSVAFVVDREEI